METFLIKAAQLILSLSILVIVHEFGHFIPARLFKTRVEKFYLFFNPWFSLFKKKIGETEWGIGWLPLGGYVKIAGMVDESMDKEQLAQEPQPWEFRSKPAWQRLIIMIGGVTVNVITALFIYILIFFTWGEEQIMSKDLSAGMAIHPYMEKYNLRSGDNIIRLNGEEVTHFNDINAGVMLRDQRDLEVQHADGSVETVHLPEDIEYELFQNGVMQMVNLRDRATTIDSIPQEDTILRKNGFQEGDQILTINDQSISYYDDLEYAKHKWKGKKVNVNVLRGTDTLALSTVIGKDGQFGYIRSPQFMDIDKAHTVYYGFGASIGKGLGKAGTTMSDYVSQLKFLFTKKGASSIGGFGTIGKLFPPVWDWHVFWEMTALLSIILAVMNILPIPALDGGHIMFLLYEMITGREAPQKVLEYAQTVGIVLLLGLMLYANGNDVIKAIFN